MLPEPALLLDGSFQVLCANSKLDDLLGLTDDQIIGLPVSRLYAQAASECDVDIWRTGTEDDERRLLWLHSTTRGKVPIQIRSSKVQVDGKSATFALLCESSPHAAGGLNAHEHSLVDSFGIGQLEIDCLAAPPDVRWFYDRVHPDDASRVQAARTRALAADVDSPDFIEEELRWAHPDGRERWLLLRINALFEEFAGKRVASRVVGAVLDITDRKLAEEERALRSAILDATPDFVAIADRQGKFLYLVERLVDETIAVQLHVPREVCRIKIDPTQLHQVLLNLVINARDAMPRGGNLTLEAISVRFDVGDVADRLGLEAGSYVVLAVSDTGEGMDEATKSRIFEPFFSTKAPGQGTGLGLSTVFGIVQQSGGTIWVYSEPGFGTIFKLYFPSSEEMPDPLTGQTVSMQTMVEGEGVVLVVEDEAQLRQMVTVVLQRAGYDVLSAANGQEALALASGHDQRIDLLITDVLMPGMNGAQLAARVLQRSPSTAVLVMSGYTENSIVHHGILDPDVHFVAKPITPGRLLAAIQRALQ